MSKKGVSAEKIDDRIEPTTLDKERKILITQQIKI